MEKIIDLGDGDWIKLEDDQLTSNLKGGTTDALADIEYSAAIDGILNLILAHHCAGIDVSTPAYVEGITTALEAIAFNVA